MNQKQLIKFTAYSLVMYKSGPAKVIKVNDKIEIELEDKKTIMVREKDITFLHPGPVTDLAALNTSDLLEKDIEEICKMLPELIQPGETINIREFAELAYESFTPQSAWAVCRHLIDSLYITGTLDDIKIRSIEEAEKEKASRKAKTDEKSEWKEFTVRARQGSLALSDSKYMKDLELSALGKPGGSKLLKELKIQETPENAHALLLRLQYWDYSVNPYINRLGFSAINSYPPLDIRHSDVFSEKRIDLTHLEAYAVDDEGNTDPDDALSFEDGRLWIHVADPSCAVTSGSEADIYAMNQGSNIYLPEIKISMLPESATSFFGLGLQTESPALSICIEQENNGSIKKCGIYLSKVKVKRITYAMAQERINSFPFNRIFDLAMKYKNFRMSEGAAALDFPEVKIKVTDSKAAITPYIHYDSAEMIKEAMLMAGEGAARYAAGKGIPFLYSTQGGKAESDAENTGNAGESELAKPAGLYDMFALRRQMSPGAVKSRPDAHSGLGISAYSRVTSPLRRYLDLAAHQQLRLSLEGKPLLSDSEIISRIGAASAGAAAAGKLEKLSNMHWTLVYLLQNPGWEGEGIVVEKRDRTDTVIIPELGFETSIPAQKNRQPDEAVRLKVTGIDLPALRSYFSAL